MPRVTCFCRDKEPLTFSSKKDEDLSAFQQRIGEKFQLSETPRLVLRKTGGLIQDMDDLDKDDELEVLIGVETYQPKTVVIHPLEQIITPLVYREPPRPVRALDIPIHQRTESVNQINTMIQNNLQHRASPAKQNHSFGLGLGGSGVGKTTLQAIAWEICKRFGGLPIYIDFSNGDRLDDDEIEQKTPMSEVLGKRIAKKVFTDQTTRLRHLPNYTSPSLDFPIVMKYVSGALDAKNSIHPTLFCILLDEVQKMDLQQLKQMAHTIGEYMTASNGVALSITHNIVVVPILTGTLDRAHFGDFFQVTGFNNVSLDVSLFTWDTIWEIVFSDWVRSRNASINNYDSPLFRAILSTYGTLPRGLEYLLEEITRLDLEQMDTPTLQNIEDAVDTKIIGQYTVSSSQ
jgi:hypothetical protein